MVLRVWMQCTDLETLSYGNGSTAWGKNLFRIVSVLILCSRCRQNIEVLQCVQCAATNGSCYSCMLLCLSGGSASFMLFVGWCSGAAVCGCCIFNSFWVGQLRELSSCYASLYPTRCRWASTVSSRGVNWPFGWVRSGNFGSIFLRKMITYGMTTTLYYLPLTIINYKFKKIKKKNNMTENVQQ